MTRTPPEIEQPPAPDPAIFVSLDAFRGHCGQPSLPIEQCPICSAIPDHCYRQTVSSLVSGDHDQIEAARSASRVEAPAAERVDDHLVVRLWMVSRKRLILRIVTVEKTGAFLREDAVIMENLPV